MVVWYLACGVPTIASPVGVGVRASRKAIKRSLLVLLRNGVQRDMVRLRPESREQMRIAGQSRLKQCFSLQVNASWSYQAVREAQQ
jgi:hypothetical protein